MVDPAGLVLAVVPTIISCADLYRMITTAKHAGEDSRTLLMKLQVQQMRFSWWLEDWGFNIRRRQSGVAVVPEKVLALQVHDQRYLRDLIEHIYSEYMR